MTYKVSTPQINASSFEWLTTNLMGPISEMTISDLQDLETFTTGNLYIGCSYKGPNWKVWRQQLGNRNDEYYWVTIGIFENKEDAVLFQLSWL